MKTQFLWIFIISVAFIILTDLYTWRGTLKLVGGLQPASVSVIRFIYFGITVTMLVWLLVLMLIQSRLGYDRFYSAILLFTGAFILFYVPKLFFIVFQLLRDIVFLLGEGFVLVAGKSHSASETVRSISGSGFLLQIGVLAAGLPFVFILYGIFIGRFNYKEKHVVISSPDVPEGFNGTRFVQISDFHIGSFSGNTERIRKAVEAINKADADYLLFTGDMVNTKATEVLDFLPELKKLNPRKGMFSVLGNHDYGDYYPWDSVDARNRNLELLAALQAEAGFRLLRNESILLRSGEDSIALIGIENWGLPPFPQHGDLRRAVEGVREVPFKILLSHDPSHWDAEVLKKTGIQLTLSGHTHGMQFALKIPGIHWSPVKFKYPRWAGLYREGNQYLYVNIGLGFIGFPGRVGTPPEITVLEIRKE
jgi:predicted MPP superfamily phosphohydrolase